MSCVAVHNGANPALRSNRIHDSRESGIYIFDTGQGIFEDNDIFANTFSGVGVTTEGGPTLRRNKIYNSKQGGVHVHDKGLAIFERNTVSNNGGAGNWDIKKGCEVTRKDND